MDVRVVRVEKSVDRDVRRAHTWRVSANAAQVRRTSRARVRCVSVVGGPVGGARTVFGGWPFSDGHEYTSAHRNTRSTKSNKHWIECRGILLGCRGIGSNKYFSVVRETPRGGWLISLPKMCVLVYVYFINGRKTGRFFVFNNLLIWSPRMETF